MHVEPQAVCPELPCFLVSHVLQDNILAHYGNKLNLVTKGIKTLKQFRELQKQDNEVSTACFVPRNSGPLHQQQYGG